LLISVLTEVPVVADRACCHRRAAWPPARRPVSDLPRGPFSVVARLRRCGAGVSSV